MSVMTYEESDTARSVTSAAAAATPPRLQTQGCRVARTTEDGEPHIPYPNHIGPRDYHGHANRIVELPGGITVSLVPIWQGSYLPCPMHPTGPVYFIHRRPIPLPADRIVEPILRDMTMQVRERRFYQAMKMLDRLANLPPAVMPKRPDASAFARQCFPDQTPGGLSAAAWGQVCQHETAWVQSTYGPALKLYEQRRSAIWTAVNQDL